MHQNYKRFNDTIHGDRGHPDAIITFIKVFLFWKNFSALNDKQQHKIYILLKLQ